ncbi:MAG TPA: sulfotransferase [Saprospiraceae bacterium]|nr:sulfotransferase [Saprospiraceae bacterium]HNT22340.1 sulfotransferase [Saprospiraceae bacterium]
MQDKKGPDFFILGLPRSGTTLLEQMLDAHSEIAVCPEMSTGKTLWRLNAESTLRDQWKSLLLVNALYQRARTFKDPILPCLAHQALRSFTYPISTGEWFSPLIREYVGEKKANLYGEKTPENTFFIPALNRAFPGSKYLLILRNPFDLVLSLCEAWAFHKKIRITDALLLHFAENTKRGLHELFIRQRLRNLDSLTITYEDLVRKPDQTLTEICTFLGLEFEPGMKDFQFRKEYTGGKEAMKFLLGRLDEPLTDQRIDRSLDILSAEQIGMLHRYLSPEIHALPYTFPNIQVRIPLFLLIRVYWAKLKFFLRLFYLEELKNKLRFQVHYYAIRLLSEGPIKNYFYKNLKHRPSDWVVS